MTGDSVGRPPDFEPEDHEQAAQGETQIAAGPRARCSPEKRASKHDWMDYANLLVLIGAFIAAVAAACEAARLADLTDVAISDTRKTAEQQSRDTQSSLALTKQAAAAATVSAQAALKQATAAERQTYALRGNLRFDGVSIAPQFGSVAPQQTPGWDLNPRWTNVGATDVRNFVGWWATIIIPISPGLSPEDKLRRPCPVAQKPETLGHPVIISPGAYTLQSSQTLSYEDAMKSMGPPGVQIIYAVGHVEYNDIFPDTAVHHWDWCIVEYANDTSKGAFSPFIINQSAD